MKLMTLAILGTMSCALGACESNLKATTFADTANPAITRYMFHFRTGGDALNSSTGLHVAIFRHMEVERRVIYGDNEWCCASGEPVVFVDATIRTTAAKGDLAGMKWLAEIKPQIGVEDTWNGEIQLTVEFADGTKRTAPLASPTIGNESGHPSYAYGDLPAQLWQ